MKSEDFEYLRLFLKTRSGLVVNPDKIYLLESRLTPVARRLGMENLDQLVTKLRIGNDRTLAQDVTEAMTTNESFFFRDNTPFDCLKRTVLPALRQEKKDRKRIRIWCAAASSGQEPYSIAMIFKEQADLWNGWQIEILGTDLSTSILRKAEAGIYSQFEVQRGLPIQFLMKYFKETGDAWVLNDEVRRMVVYKEMNLLESFSLLGAYDIIFCRNVLIYFDPEAKSDVLNRMSDVLTAGGSLFLGAAETVLGISDHFKPVRDERGLYRQADKV